MRRGIGTAVLLVLAACAYWLWSRGDQPAITQEAGARRAHLQASKGSMSARRGTETEGSTSADEDATPPLEEPARASDGAVEVTVLRRGEPVEHAQVRLYWRGDVDPSTQHAPWRIAGKTASGHDGKATIPARPGRYLVTAHLDGTAPARAMLSRPHGEPLSRLTLNLASAEILDGSVVTQEQGEPVPAAELTLSEVAGGLPSANVELPVEERALVSSDARGRFHFAGLEPGRYRLEARAAGYGAATVSDVEVPRNGELRVELFAAGTLEGFVVDVAGKAAAGAEVMAIGAAEPVVATSGPGGGFSLEVPAGAYRLAAKLGAQAGARTGTVSVGPGKVLRDLRITLGDACRISGVVTAQTSHAPIAGARVEVSPHRYSGDSGRTTTGPDGTFTVEPLPPGSYDVDVRAAGFSGAARFGLVVQSGQNFPLSFQLAGMGRVEGTVRDSGGHSLSGVRVLAFPRARTSGSGASFEARTDEAGHFGIDALPAGIAALAARRDGEMLGRAVPVTITEGATARGDLTLDDAVSVSGHATLNSGKPLEGATVSASPLGLRVSTPLEGDVASVVDGSYHLMLPPGSYTLTLRDRSGPLGVESISVAAGQPLQKNFVIADADKVHLKGLVLEADGSPAVGAEVVALARVPVAMGSTGPDGRFDLALTADARPPLQVQARVEWRSGQATAADFTAPVAITLSAPASLRGTVAGGAAGSLGPLTATVRMLGEHHFVGFATTQEFVGDSFQIDKLLPGAVEVTVRSLSGLQGRAETTLTAGQTQTVTLTLQPSTSVTGRLVNARTGEPVAGHLFYDQVNETMHAEADSDGRFTFGNVPPGTHQLIGSILSTQIPKTAFTVAEGQQVDLGDIKVTTHYSAPGSVGLSFWIPNGTRPVINDVYENGPAAQAGILPGDAIVEIDGHPLAGGDAVPLLRSLFVGQPGSLVLITVERNGARQTFRVTRAS